jgi:hypothetical protein
MNRTSGRHFCSDPPSAEECIGTASAGSPMVGCSGGNIWHHGAMPDEEFPFEEGQSFPERPGGTPRGAGEHSPSRAG